MADETALSQNVVKSPGCVVDFPWVEVQVQIPQLACLFSNLRDLAEVGEQTPWLRFSFQDHGVINACDLMLVVSLQGVLHRTTKCY